MKPLLKTYATNRLTAHCDELLSNFAVNVNLRRYTKASLVDGAMTPRMHKRLVIAAEETWRHYEESLPEFEEALRMVARCRSIR